MADIKSKEKRSQNMAAIKSKDTKPEIYFRKLLFSKGYRYRKHPNYVFGKPDFYLGKYKTAVFVHGCFWHRHPGCKYAYQPKSNAEFWNQKFLNNMSRDQKVRDTLLSEGYKVLIVWECTLKKMKKEKEMEESVLKTVEQFFQSDESCLEI